MSAAIRPAAPADAPALAAFKLHCYRQTFLDDGFAIPYPPADLAIFEAESYGVNRVAAGLADPARRTWLAEQDGALAGYVHLGPCKLPHADAGPAEGEIYQLYVDRAAQGQHLGQRLMAIALDWLTAHRPGPIWVGVWSGNLKAQAFYRHHGFSQVGEYLFPVGEWRDREFIYRRD